MKHALNRRDLALAAASVMVFAACTGGAAEDAEETTTTGSDTAKSAAEPGTGDSDVLLGVGCAAALQSMGEAAAAVGTATVGGGDGMLDESVAEQFRAMAEVAPSEISDDLEVFADQMKIMVEAFAGIDFQPGQIPTDEQMAELEAAFEAIDEEAFEEASANIEAWLEANC